MVVATCESSGIHLDGHLLLVAVLIEVVLADEDRTNHHLRYKLRYWEKVDKCPVTRYNKDHSTK